MPYRRKSRKTKKTSNRQLRKRINNAKKFIFGSKMLNSILRKNLVHYHFGFRKINEHEDHIGQQELSWTNTHYPLNIVNLNSIINTNGTITTTGLSLQALQSNGYSFSGIENVSLINKMGGTLSDTMDSVDMLYQRWFKLNLCLWADTQRATTYKVYLVKINDSMLDPFDANIDTSSAEVQDIRKQVFQNYFLSDQLSSPIVPKGKITPAAYKKFSILWKKTYIIDEQLSDRDQRPHQVVKIFRNVNKNISYQRNKSLNYQSLDNPELVSSVNNDSQKRAYPEKVKDQVFMIITANCTKNQAEDAENYHKATYDILAESKYTSLVFPQ